MGSSIGPNVIGEGLVFGYDTGFPMVSQSLDNTYLYNNGVPAKNIARVMTSWPTKARASVATYSGDIEPPIPGEAIYKLTCNADNAGILIRDGGFYYGGGFSGTGNAQNTDILSDRTNSYTPAGNNKFIYSLYVRPTNNTLSNTSAYIDIGDRGVVSKSNVENLTGWHKLVCNDSLGINSQYPYDFFDLGFGPNTIGNEILISAIQIIRTPGTDSGSLQTPSQFPQHLTYGAERTFSNSLLDLTGNHTINLNKVSFAGDSLIDFDGTDDRIDTALYHLSGSDHTEEVVVYRDTAGVQQGILSDLQYGFFGLYFQSDNKIRYRQMQQLSNPTSYPNVNVVTPDTYGVGTYHIVGSFSSTNGFRLYVNGVLKNSNSTDLPFNLSGNRGINHIGVYKDSAASNYNHPFNGQIYLVRCYNRELTAGEIEQNFTALRGRFNI